MRKKKISNNIVLLSVLAGLLLIFGLVNIEELPYLSALQLFVAGAITTFIMLDNYIRAIRQELQMVIRINNDMGKDFVEIATELEKVSPDKLEKIIGGQDGRHTKKRAN
jgi:hypothetical protein